MKVVVKDNHKVVTPQEGMWLTDGTTVSDELFMPLDARVDEWREITDAEKVALEAELEKQQESEVNDETE